MTYSKLSDEVQQLPDPQQSAAFVKHFRDAVRDGQFDAVDLQERFVLPKVFRRRGSEETYQRDVKDMIFERTPAFEAWRETTQQTLASSARPRKPKLTVENLEAGVLDFKALAEETRRKLQRQFEKGQALGQSRRPAKTAAKKSRSGGRKAKA